MKLLPSILLLALTIALAGAAPTVLSVDRLYRNGEADLVEAGEILLAELHCVQCHATGGEVGKRIPSLPGPDLRESVGNVRVGYLKKWLSNPHRTEADTRMPNVLANLEGDEREEMVESLTAFLQTLRADASPDGLRSNPEGNARRGSQLFHAVGCVACHAPRADFKETSAGDRVDGAAVKSRSLPLSNLGEKYTRSGLSRFLAHPHKSRPSGRMPKVALTAEERTDLVTYLLRGAPLEKLSHLSDGPEIVTKGRRQFAKVGCANCHQVVEKGGQTIISALPAKSLADLAPEGGCLSGEGSAPRYHLDEFQRRALAAALTGLSKRKVPTSAQLVHRRLVSLNCYACHERGGVGGMPEDRLPYLTSSALDLGDEGRVPPTLSGVGRKMQRGAIAQVIRGQFPVRPYLVTRMPDYGEAHAEFLARHLAVADHDPTEKPTPRHGRENQVGRNLWGRALMGTEGLSCVTCHSLRGEKSLGIQAMDLAHVPGRLRPEWFRDYLINPARFRPGTRMPSFWPGGKPTVRVGGSTERQIDSLWVYLSELDQSRLPEGLEKKGDFLLTPRDKPIVFRTFFERVGMHAVAVGYAESLHAAYDSRNPRWVLAWTGAFLDAESTWDDRFTPLAQPQGGNVIAIQPHAPVHESDMEAKFLGYQLHLEKAHPVFLFELGAEQYSDVLLPVAAKKKEMIRTLTRLRGTEERWIEVANGSQIRRKGDHWLVDEKLLVLSSGDLRVIKGDKGQHLQVKLGERTSLTYTW